MLWISFSKGKNNWSLSDDKNAAEILNDYLVNIAASREVSEVEENWRKANELQTL